MDQITTQTQTIGSTSRRPITRPAFSDLATGRPTGPSITQPPSPTQAQTSPIMQPLLGDQSPMTIESTYYIPGYLNTKIGYTMRIEFLIGTNCSLNDRIGTLLGVGASYILIRPIGTDDTLLCDIYSIKFITIYDKPLKC